MKCLFKNKMFIIFVIIVLILIIVSLILFILKNKNISSNVEHNNIGLAERIYYE